MKRIIKYLCLIAISCIALLAYFSININNKNVHHVNKTEQSNDSQHVVKSMNLVAIGDSLTQGVGDVSNNGGYVPRIKQLFDNRLGIDLNVKNYGIAGERSDQINQRVLNKKNIQQDIKNANIVVITVGGNDLLQALQKNALISNENTFRKNMTKALDTYQSNLNKLLHSIKQYNDNCNIYLFGVYNPLYVYFANVDKITDYVNKLNLINSTTANDYKACHYVDINSLTYGQFKTEEQRKSLLKDAKHSNFNVKDFSREESDSKEINDYLSDKDNFHPNDAGYDVMTNNLFKVIKNNEKFN
ncbi:SGNH/GDSL hydrolase family protein [Apilactobacillus xinyiensis]|uniref:SGNH/GDSL hydrolase family protein n=1 Tax=Apilactobacillus xinyiensis TaxID=2841032 RepID=UPI0020109DD0|nr:SGNH/GDSL hydrolase family protein [Apilactobacillus xinyiensis]MCL0329373.1 GDSL-type esterase/lipase family protein [Apilactobacillus xinyiensis]